MTGLAVCILEMSTGEARLHVEQRHHAPLGAGHAEVTASRHAHRLCLFGVFVWFVFGFFFLPVVGLGFCGVALVCVVLLCEGV